MGVEELLRQALKLKEKKRGPEHPSLCPTLTSLAVHLGQQGRLGEAAELLRRALTIARRAHGPTSFEVGQLLHTTAQLQHMLDHPEAAATARQALEVLQATLGPEHPDLLAATPLLHSIAGEEPSVGKPGPGPGAEIPMLERFAPLLRDVVAVARGADDERFRVEQALEQLEAEGWQLLVPVRRIWAGDRDVAALTEGLDPSDGLLVRAALSVLGSMSGEPGEGSDAGVLPAAGDPQDMERVLERFEPLLQVVAAGAVGGGEAVRAGVEPALAQLEDNGWRVGEAVRRIWAGERDPGALCQGLDGDSARVVQRVLELVEA